MAKFSAADKKLLAEVERSVDVDEKSLVDLLLERPETLDMPEWAMKVHQHTWPQKETLERILFSSRIEISGNLDAIMVSRRFAKNEPRQMALFSAFALRSAWLRYGHLTWPWAALSDLSPIVAMACNDQLMIKRFEAMKIPIVDLPGNKNDPLLKGKVMLDVVLGVLLGRRDVVDGAIVWFEGLPKNQVSDGMRSYFAGYLAILDGDATRFVESMETLYTMTRKTRGLISASHKLVNLWLHGMYELALSKDPKLVENWDHERPLPWDAGFHHWRRTNEEPLTLNDLAGLDDERKRLLIELPVPQWWSNIEKYPVPLPS